MSSPVVEALEAQMASVLRAGAGKVAPFPDTQEAPVSRTAEERLPGDGPVEVDRRLVALVHEKGPLRAVLARLASRLVGLRAWERLGYARPSDYAAECLGLSARWVRSLARVGATLDRWPELEASLVSGELGWTKVRLLARLAPDQDVVPWLAHARQVSVEDLSRAVRAVDQGSVEAGAAGDPNCRRRRFEVRCTPEVRWKWAGARSAAARVAGRVLHVSEAAELVAAEVLSALPIDEEAESDQCDEEGAAWGQEPALEETEAPAHPGRRESMVSTLSRPALEPRPPWAGRPTKPVDAGLAAEARNRARRLLQASYSPILRELLDGVEAADAFEVDERLRRAVSMEQGLEARVGPLLSQAWERWVYRALGYSTREAYARERLGMDPTRARALVRLERAAVESAAFGQAYRAGALSWVKGDVLLPLLRLDPMETVTPDWLAWAGRVTVRRLREDVERAVALAETDPGEFRRHGGLPPDAQDREFGAADTGREHDPRAGGASRGIGSPEWDSSEEATAGEEERGIGAPSTARRESTPVAGAHGHMNDDPWPRRHPEPLKSAPGEVCWASFIGPAEVVQLFKAVLCTVRRRMERVEGRLPTSGEALGAMLDHAFASWGMSGDEKVARRHRVFERDGWRCAAPGCTSMQNLHDHHVRFRSAGGPDTPENRITLCAFHHLRGVHAGLLRCMGRAPDGLRWEMGIRPGVTPRLAYRSGDIRIPLDDRGRYAPAGRAILATSA